MYGPAENAIDGNRDGNWVWDLDRNSITLTKTSGADAWWKLTFLEILYIDRIVIWNRMNDASERIHLVSVQVGEAFIGTVDYQHGQSAYTFEELGVLGDEITIRGSAETNHVIQLAEVEVFGGKVVLNGKSREVQVLGEEVKLNRFLSCAARRISRTMKMVWSGWNSDEQEKFVIENEEYSEEGNYQRSKLKIGISAASQDKKYTCVLSSQRFQPSQSISVEVYLLVYEMECENKRVSLLERQGAVLVCKVLGIAQGASLTWTLDAEVF